MYFREWNVLYSDANLTEVCSKVSNWQASIGSVNGDPVHWRIYVYVCVCVGVCVCVWGGGGGGGGGGGVNLLASQQELGCHVTCCR